MENPLNKSEVNTLAEGFYRAHFTGRSAWNAYLVHERDTRGRVVHSYLLYLDAERPVRDRRFTLAATKSGVVVVPSKPHWGELYRLVPRAPRVAELSRVAYPRPTSQPRR